MIIGRNFRSHNFRSAACTLHWVSRRAFELGGDHFFSSCGTGTMAMATKTVSVGVSRCAWCVFAAWIMWIKYHMNS